MPERISYGWRMTLMGALMHFLVDGLCLCCLWLMTNRQNLLGAESMGMFVNYNVLAFLTQPLTGAWADRMKQKHWMLLGAVVLLTMAVMCASLSEAAFCSPHSSLGDKVARMAVATLLGLGNSLFHVWGGKQTAIGTGNDIRALGVFVSTGVMGLTLGGLFCSWGLLYAFLLILCVLAIRAPQLQKVESLHDVLEQNTNNGQVTNVTSAFSLWGLGGVAIGVLMVLVMLRSYIGESFSGDLEKNDLMILLIGGSAMLGKMAGGWLVKAMGMLRAMVTVLLVVLVCLFGRSGGLAIVMAGIFAVNCTMPATLYLANVVLKGREGLAFGLLAGALIPGYLLAFVDGMTFDI